MTRQGDESGDLWAAAAVGLSLGLAGVGVWAATKSPPPKPDEGDVMAKKREPRWPLDLADLEAVGESVLAHRRGSGRPHHGVDLKARAGAAVLSASSGRVLRVLDGSKSGTDRGRAAGLFVDVKGSDGRIYRYLHLGVATVKEDQRLNVGDPIGEVGQTGEKSGVLHSGPHLHFEIRASDWNRKLKEYGTPIDPLSVLPLRLHPGKVRKLVA